MTSPFVSLPVSRETSQRLEHFAALFRKWSKAINLAAPSTLEQLRDRHIRDSLGVWDLAPGPAIWADLGSGGGFPGIVTAIMLAEAGDGWVHLVESNNKKAAFLRTALQETGARGSVHPIRIEDAPAVIGRVDRLSARALADLGQLCAFAWPWQGLNANLHCYFHKGRDYRREIENLNGRWICDLVEHPSKVETGSVILEMTRLQPAG